MRIDILSETYLTLKQYIPSKDRQEAADSVMSVLVDMLNDTELKEFSESDSYLERAYKEYAGEYEDEDEDSGYEE
jgi:hypothetical protein